MNNGVAVCGSGDMWKIRWVGYKRVLIWGFCLFASEIGSQYVAQTGLA